MNNILIYSDLHISQESLKECALILEEIGTLANKYNCDTLINLGDTFDTLKPSSKELDVFATFINRLGENKKHIILAADSHESETQTISIINHFGILNKMVIVVKEYKDNGHLYCGHFSLKESSKNYDARLSKINLKNYCYVFLGHIHCVTPDTEILTEQGWKKYNEIYIGEKIATFNMETKTVEYQPLLNVHSYTYEGKLYEFEKRALVTPNHRMVLNNKSPYIKLAYQIKQGDKLIINTRKWNYPILHKFNNPYWAELIGFIIGDGHYDFIKSNHFTVSIRQKIGYNTKIYLPRLLKRCNLNYTIKRRNTNYPEFNISFTHNENKDFLNFLRNYVLDKKLNRILVSLPREQLMRLYLGLITSDGHYYNKGNQIFGQKDYCTIEFFEELCLKIGRQFKTYHRIQKRKWDKYNFISDSYQVNIQNNITKVNNPILKAEICKKNIKEIYYEGIVWCPTVENGTWIAKRNGRPFITGNSYEVIKPNICHLGSSRYVSFDEAKDKQKVVALIADYNGENEKVHFIPLKSPIKMVEIELQQKTSEMPENASLMPLSSSEGKDTNLGNKSKSQAQTKAKKTLSLGECQAYLDKLDPNTKVKVKILDFKSFKEFLPIEHKYQNKFVKFVRENDFDIISDKSPISAKKEIDLLKSFTDFAEEKQIDPEIKTIIENELKDDAK